MTGIKFLEYFGKVRGKYDPLTVKKYAERFDIKLDRKVKEYSKGMRQKVAIIQAFACEPDLIIMDEATNGLDPLVQQIFMEVVHEEVNKGRTIFMSSHQLAEVEKVCNRVAIIREGRIVAQESVEDLQKKSGKVFDVKFTDPVSDDKLWFPGVTGVIRLNGHYRLNVVGNPTGVLKELMAANVADINIHPMTLEDIFMQYYAGGK
jgi:ABC-2 type transport system ATP-binding protein